MDDEIEFQSAPGAEAGRNANQFGAKRGQAIGFNPPPALRPGGTPSWPRSCTMKKVSIRPRR